MLIKTLFVLFSASAPTRTLGRRKLVRHRFTIDTDIAFDVELDQSLTSPEKSGSDPLQLEGEADQRSESASDTDRWVEEQFDLEEYEDQEEVKETDILSDDDEHCGRRLEASVAALSLESEEDGLRSPPGTETLDDETWNPKEAENDHVWIRRETAAPSPDPGL